MWFQDGTKLLVSGPAGPKDRSGVWILPLATGKLQKLADDALGGAALSPDESRIVFRRSSAPEIWTMKVTGEEARKLLDVAPDSVHQARLAWFPDGRRIAFASASRAGQEFSINSYDLTSGKTSVVLSDPKGGDFCLAGDGRIVYTRLEAPPNEKTANVWEADLDPSTARVVGPPRRLTHWPGSMFGALGSTRDGRRLFFLRLHTQNSVYTGQLDRGRTGLLHARRFSFEQWTSWPTGWSRDSKAVFFNSDSVGQPDIFQQSLDARDVTPLAAGTGERRDARLSPDGKWLLYLQWPWEQGAPSGETGHMMRSGAQGGPAQELFTVTGYSRRIRTDPLVSISAEGYPAFRCAAQPGAGCVLSEEIRGEVVFTAFDPLRGRGAELARIPSSSITFWDLSPDARWIAAGKYEETSGRIRLVSMAGEPPRDIQVKGWTHLLSASWSADGKALYVTAFASRGAPLLRVLPDGTAQLLYRGLKYVENPVASPDGSRLAFGEMTQDGNAWVLDSLP